MMFRFFPAPCVDAASAGEDVWRTRGPAYLFALAAGLWLVLSVFPRDLLLSGVVADARLTGDVAQHVIGQRAYFGDGWHWPLLRTLLLDAPGGLSIAMTDSNPLVALPLKLFARLLPPGFSAIQLWMAVAYVLQPPAAVFALRSAGETRVVPAIAAALFAVATPTFLFRHPHSALSSHFVLLVALGGYFRIVRCRPGGAVLSLVLPPISLLLHPYLAAMTDALLLAAPATLLLRGDRAWMRAALHIAGGLALTVLVMAALGYGASNPTGGFGEVSMNVLSPIYPTYSHLLGVNLGFIDATGAQYEGYQYLGLGLLILLGLCLVCAVVSTRTVFLRRHNGLVLACLGLSALAVSSVVYIGLHKVVTLHHVPAVLNQLRASGRLFWPVTYVLLIGAVASLPRLLPFPLAAVLVLGTAVLQVIDTHDMRVTIARDLRATAPQPVDAATLDGLIARHANLVVLPSFGCGANARTPEFMQLLLAATRLRVPVNTMYVARFAHLQHCDDAELALRPLQPGELRVFLPTAAEGGPAVVPDGARRCRRLDTIALCSLAEMPAALKAAGAAPFPLGRTVVIATPLATPLLGPGWYQTEPQGVWTVDQAAVMSVQLDAVPAGDLRFSATGLTFTGRAGVAQSVALFANGQAVRQWWVPGEVPASLTATIPHADLAPGPLVLRMVVGHPVRPSDAGINSDTRELGFFLQSLRLDAVQ